MVKRISDDLYGGLSPVEQACVHHFSMRHDYRLPDGTPLPFADSGVRHIQLSTAINLFSADPETGYEMLKIMYPTDASAIYQDLQQLLVCTSEGSVEPEKLVETKTLQRAAGIVNPLRTFATLQSRGRIEIIGARSYPKLTDDLGFSIIAIADKYRLLDDDKIERIMAPYR